MSAVVAREGHMQETHAKPSGPIIEAINVVKTYDTGKVKVNAFRRMSVISIRWKFFLMRRATRDR